MDWSSICQLADTRQLISKYSNNKRLWDIVWRSSPIPLTSSSETLWLMIRLLYKKTEKRYYIDLRAFEKKDYEKESEKETYYKQTNLGLCLSFGQWVKVIFPILQTIKRYGK